MPRRTAPMFGGFPPPREDACEDGWDLVIKAKYSGTLKRFSAHVNGQQFDHNLAALRSKILSAFKFGPDADFVLTYTDEDGDVVMLDDDVDLLDAVISQRLNPLRIDVHLKSSSAGAAQTTQQTSDCKSPMSSLEDQLAQVKSAIDEAFKFVPEQVPIVLAKLSHDLRSKAASSAPSLADLLDWFAKLMSPKNNMQPSSGSPDVTKQQTMGSLNIENESELNAVSASKPLDMQNSEALGLKSALVGNASGYLLVEDPLISTSSGWKNIDPKGSADAQSKGNPVRSSAVPSIATFGLGDPTVQSAGAAFSCEREMFRHSGDLNSAFPPPPAVSGYRSFPPTRATRNNKSDCFYPPPSFRHQPDITSSVNPYGRSPEGIYSFGASYRDHKNKSMAHRTLHRWIQCDGCGVTPIAGSRYKSNVKDDYDLCSSCFGHMGNEAEFTKIDRPTLASECLREKNKNQMLVPQIQQFHDSRFIKDVTVPDGTLMAPSTPFTKIWRLHNNGSTVWPFGTKLIWVGGDHFARQSSVTLGISADGFPVNQEIDVAVNFVAPAKPGRFLSSWSLASPTRQVFGQRIWVLIQVGQPAQTSSRKQTAAINLNLLPEGNSSKWEPSIDMNVEPTDHVYPESTSTDPFARALFRGATIPKEYAPVPSSVCSVPTTFEPVQVPNTDHLASSAGGAGLPAPEIIPLPKVSAPASVPPPVPVVGVPAAASVSCVPDPISVSTSSAASPPSPKTVDKMLKELEVMGFGQVDLNKEILRQNRYNLEQSVDDLCGFHDWDPLNAELHELGF